MKIHPPAQRTSECGLPRNAGSAIVIVLAFIVLLTAIVLAVFNRAISERKISNSSASQMTVSALADGGIATVIADLDAEIKAKSTPFVLADGSKLYIPTTPQGMVPERVGTADTLPNLIKRSQTGKPFFTGTGSVDRAADLPSDKPSQNGRFVSLARWNSHFLLPKADTNSDTDGKPVGDFTAPDWILVTNDGSHVTTAAAKVIGRYAYAIYDEGGLLDLNAAGYPRKLADDKKASQRGSLAFADLTQLTASLDGTGAPLFTPEQVDAIVGRRNFVSASLDRSITPPTPSALGGNFPNFTFTTQNAENYRRFGIYSATNFLTTPRDNSLDGQSDRLFLTRQEMISFLLGGLATSPDDRAKFQSALQYLTQFTRDINQPSIMPPTGRPRTKQGFGNNSFTLDTADEVQGLNPNFLKVRRTVEMPAANSLDGTVSKVGDPVMKKRFPLSRIAWLTFKGPIAPSGVLSSDPDIKLLIDKYKAAGMTEEFLRQGTEQNIKKAFGLEWLNDPNTKNLSGLKIWVYHKDASYTKPKVALLKTIAGNGQEVDFFALLRGAVTAGAITRAGNVASGLDTFNPLQIQAIRDESSILATVQLGANIIDQFDPDGYPTQISVDDLQASPAPKAISGVENLPYIYRIRTGLLTVEKAIPAAAAPLANGGQTAIFKYTKSGGYYTGSETGPPADPNGSNGSIRPNVAPEGPLQKTGCVAYLVMPDIWNPHNSDSTIGDPGPTEFRVVVDTVDPANISIANDSTSKFTAAYNAFNAYSWKNTTQLWSDQNALTTIGFSGKPDGSFTGWDRRAAEQNGFLTFTVPKGNKTLFTDPTILFMANTPAESQLSLGSVMVNDPFIKKFIKPVSGQASVYGFVNDGTVDPAIQPPSGLNNDNKFVGIPLGMAPMRWIGPRPSGGDQAVSSWIYSGLWVSENGGGSRTAGVTSPSGYATVSLKYKDTTGKWVYYDQKYTAVADTGQLVPHGNLHSGPIVHNTAWTGFTDPRTARLGPMFHYSYRDVLFTKSIPPPVNTDPAQWLNAAQGTVGSDWPDAGAGLGATVTGWYDNKTLSGWPGSLPQNLMHKGKFSQNLKSNAEYYLDGDGVIRPAMGAGAIGTTGLPMATGQNDSRPVMLNRPFRSVGELGYVFSGNPWKNIDFSNVQSGYSALLDAFCINETSDPSGLVAGKVSLNTRQIPVLKAIISGAYKNETDPNAAVLTSALATTIAKALTDRTASTAIGKGPLQNVSDLVGRWISGTGDTPTYEGFSKDLFGDRINGGSAILPNPDSAISGLGESVIRSLASVGTTRVWNLMIDMIAQTGKFPPGSPNFVVEGEQRYWVHLAIDRFSGKVLDMKTEIVKE